MDSNSEAIRTLRDDIRKQEESATAEREDNRARIDDLEAQLIRHREEARTELQDTVARTVREELRNSGVNCTSVQDSSLSITTSSAHSKRFWECRRSLRIWPVPGPNRRDSFVEFLKNKMEFDEDSIKDLGSYTVQETRANKARNPEEVLVYFESKESRDLVKGGGTKLAKYGQTAGIRIQVPGHLMSNFRVLESLAFHLKQKDSTLRRVVKFDEDCMDLFMDVKVMGEWRRVYPDQARVVQASRPDFRSGPAILTADVIQGLLGDASCPASGSNSEPLGV